MSSEKTVDPIRLAGSGIWLAGNGEALRMYEPARVAAGISFASVGKSFNAAYGLSG